MAAVTLTCLPVTWIGGFAFLICIGTLSGLLFCRYQPFQRRHLRDVASQSLVRLELTGNGLACSSGKRTVSLSVTCENVHLGIIGD